MTTKNNQQPQSHAGPVAQQLAVMRLSGQLSPDTGQPRHIKKSKWGLSDKTLWDWLQLLVVPIVLAGITFGLGLEQSRINDENNQKQHNTDIQIATDQQQQTLLQGYLDYITSLILGVNTGKDSPTLINAQLGDEISQVARAHTLVTVARLDPKRKGFLLRFLYDAKLINKSHVLIDLYGADLSGADLSNVNLAGVDLNGVNLIGANLEGVNLSEASLNGTLLDEAKLHYANLFKASLSNLTVRITDETIISHAYLRNADLRAVDLSDANLTNADLNGANVMGAELGAVILNGTILKGVKYNTKAIQDQNDQGQPATDDLGKPLMLKPTSWNPAFNPLAAGAHCVDC